MAEHQVLFCPFCRESFEGLRSCPDHDLALVPFHKLAPDRHDEPAGEDLDDDAPLGALEPRFGRAYVASGAALNGAALLLEFVQFPDGRAISMLLSATSLPGLWTPALVGFTLFFVLRRGRTLRALRALRLLVLALACVAPGAVLWELQRIRGGASMWAQHVRSSHVEVGPAVYVVLAAAVLIGYGGLRFGKAPARGNAGT